MSGEADRARRTYDAFAPTYDEFNRRYMYERWTGRLLAAAQGIGLFGDRLLDVGCGTGLSFIAQIERGFRVTGCDISPAMLARAREKVGDRATLVEADMRRLPVLGEFDLIWSVNDAVNYLRDRGELVATLRGMKANMAVGAVIVFDLNTLAGYRDFWNREVEIEGEEGRSYTWRGHGGEILPGARIETSFGGEGPGVVPHTHYQRHFPEAEVLGALEAAGLQAVLVLGEQDGRLFDGLDEDRHTKAVYVCTEDGTGEVGLPPGPGALRASR
jgi:SAM-dependent methyltransferase